MLLICSQPGPGRSLAGWLRHVYLAPTESEVQAIRHVVQRATPFGGAPWQARAAKRLGLEWKRATPRTTTENSRRERSCSPLCAGVNGAGRAWGQVFRIQSWPEHHICYRGHPMAKIEF